MDIDDFDFDLPNDLIAKYPSNQRTSSKLLYLQRKNSKIEHKKFIDFIDLLQKGDLLVFNQTKVMQASLTAYKKTGAKVDILVEQIIDKTKALVFLRANKSIKIGSFIYIKDIEIEILEKRDNFFLVNFNLGVEKTLNVYGSIALPPYMKRKAQEIDQNRYQTVFAKDLGAIAAPTAGLHFSTKYLALLKKKEINIQTITLHVGAGTFLPVKTQNIQEHKMHFEKYLVKKEVIEKIKETKKNGSKVIAVGSTVVRTLEAIARDHDFVSKDYQKTTNIFIKPGFKFQIVDALFTNFHLPKSTLIIMISAFSSQQKIKKAYQEAIDRKYKFFSYGDAMYID